MRTLMCALALAGCSASPAGEPVDFERVEIPVEGAYALTTGDVNGDGSLDLVVTSSGHRLVVLAGDGRGGFREVGRVAGGENPAGLAAADFDEDGDLDLAVANHETKHLTLLSGDGAGGFTPWPTSPFRVDVSPHVHAVASGDLDDDGHVDLVVDDRDREGLVPLFGRGDGTFEPGETVRMGGDPYRGMEVTDLDGDGRLDLVTPNEREVGVRSGRGDGTFRALREIDLSPLAPFAVAAGDVNGDGTVDIGAGSGQEGREVTVLEGDAAGEFRPAPGGPWEAGRGAKSMDAADLDGDGFDDLVVTSWDSPQITVLYGGREGLAGRQLLESGENPWAVSTADFDGDGRPDVAAVNSGSGTVTVFMNRGPER